jgi:lysozyme family protein
MPLTKNTVYPKLPEEYLHKILNYEGGMSEKLEKIEGFKTNRGITEGALAKAKQDNIIPNSVTIESLTTDLESVRKIYEINYYLKSKSNKLPHPLAFANFDIAVNGGIGRSTRLLQSTINFFGDKKIVIDGGIGPITLNALTVVLKKVDIKTFVKKYNDYREAFYRNLAAKNPKRYGKVIKAWLSRLEQTRKYTEN